MLRTIDTALHYAGNCDIVAFLARYCNVNHRNHCKNTLLHVAASRGQLDIVTYLIASHHCDPACRGEYGRTPLHYACAFGHIQVVKYLTSRQGVNPTCKDDDGGTPLHCAVNSQVAEFLVEEKGCNVNHRNKDRDTPLHYAAYNGRLDVVKYLLIKRRCDPACRGKDGWTPLHYASAVGHIKLVKALVDLQVPRFCEDDSGAIPLDYAKSDEIAQYLKPPLGFNSHGLSVPLQPQNNKSMNESLLSRDGEVVYEEIPVRLHVCACTRYNYVPLFPSLFSPNTAKADHVSSSGSPWIHCSRKPTQTSKTTTH